MAFIVKKKIKGNEYYYLNENKRVDGKVKTKTLAYLGKDKEEAEKKVKEMGESIKGVKITYFVHGTSTDNEKDISSGWNDVELSELGIKQSKELPKQIGNKKFDVVFSSDLKRAAESAKISFEGKVKIVQEKRLRECNYGKFNGKPSKVVEPMQEENITKKFPEGESYEDVKKRVIEFLRFLYKNHHGKHVAIVAHKAPQLSLDVILKNKSWEEAFSEDWRKKKAWQPGWEYFVDEKIMAEPKLNSIQGLTQKLDLKNKSEEINKIALTKAFFYPTASIYGSSSGFYTYGHLGKALKNNWENLWRKNILSLGDNFYEMQSNNILPEKVFIASGHVEKFNDPMTECKKCHSRYRADHLLGDNGVKDAEKLSLDEMTNLIKEKKIKCAKCGNMDFSEVKQFNMMFSVNVGFNQEKAYLSPETAQGVYIHFLEQFKATREKLPLGLAIIDKAYRNEISPRQMFFRLREFTQAELQIFFDPEKINEHENWDDVKGYSLFVKFANGDKINEISADELNTKHKIPKFYLFHAAKVQQFYLNVLNVPKERFRLRELSAEERAFYNKIHFDVEINFDTLNGFKEVAGIHYRGNHDLTGHSKVSGKNMEVFYDGKKILPHVLELSFGVDRNVWMLLDLFYSVGKEGSMFKFPANLSPIKLAVIPIVKKDEFEIMARNVFTQLKEDFSVNYDSTGSVGRRYSRADEIGVPFCITVDGQSTEDNTVTIRWRDNTEQIRVPIKDLRNIMRKVITNGEDLFKLGTRINTKIK